MGIDFILDLVINQVGEEQAKNIKEQLLVLSQKMGNDKIYILKKLGNRGVSLILTDTNDCNINFSDKKKLQVVELESILKKVEI